MSRTARPRHTTGLLAVLALSAVAAPAAAGAATVKRGHLDWTQTAIYDTTAPAGTDRTWLGYVTGPGPSLAAGTAAPIAPATGDTVTTSSPRGDGYTTTFPATSGTYDATDGTGTIELDGGLDFAGTGHGFDITVDHPQVVLDGLSGKLYASGKGSAASGTYDRSAPLFDLDLSDATVTLKADGSRVLDGIVPALATLNTAFPGNYAVGAGPDRTPNTFGAFSLTLKTDGGDAGPAGQDGATGAAGATGATGATGPAGAGGKTTTIRSVKAILAKAPFKGGATRKVSVLTGKGRILATGTVKGRVLKVTLASTVTSLSGTVRLKATATQSTATVKIPS